jgi:hypothetical protein
MSFFLSQAPSINGKIKRATDDEHIYIGTNGFSLEKLGNVKLFIFQVI